MLDERRYSLRAFARSLVSQMEFVISLVMGGFLGAGGSLTYLLELSTGRRIGSESAIVGHGWQERHFDVGDKFSFVCWCFISCAKIIMKRTIPSCCTIHIL